MGIKMQDKVRKSSTLDSKRLTYLGKFGMRGGRVAEDNSYAHQNYETLLCTHRLQHTALLLT